MADFLSPTMQHLLMFVVVCGFSIFSLVVCLAAFLYVQHTKKKE